MDRPREEGYQLGETIARWRSRIREMMKEDDAAELIAKSADTTLGVIGGDFEFRFWDFGFGFWR